jgi:hypothetical protein
MSEVLVVNDNEQTKLLSTQENIEPNNKLSSLTALNFITKELAKNTESNEETVKKTQQPEFQSTSNKKQFFVFNTFLLFFKCSFLKRKECKSEFLL